MTNHNALTTLIIRAHRARLPASVAANAATMSVGTAINAEDVSSAYQYYNNTPAKDMSVSLAKYGNKVLVEMACIAVS